MSTSVLGSTTFNTNSATTVNVSIPAETAVGSLLVATLATSAVESVSSYTSGWVSLGTRSTNQITSVVFFKRAEGADALSVTFNGGGAKAAICLALDGGDYVDGVNSEPARTNSPSAAFAPISGGRDYLFLTIRACYGDNVPSAPPIPYGGMLTAAGCSSCVSIAVATYYGSGVHSVDAGAWTSTGDFTCIGWTLAGYTCSTVSGVVTDPAGGFSEISLRAYDRDSGDRVALSGGRALPNTTCSAIDGSYSFQCPDVSKQHTVVALSPSDPYPSVLVDRVVPS